MSQYSKEIDGIFSFGYKDATFINDVHVLVGKEAIEEAKAKLETLLARAETDGAIRELNKLVKEWGYGEYPIDDPRYGMDWEDWADYRITALKVEREDKQV